MNNKKLDLHKQLIEEALSILKAQETLEEMYDFDPEYCKQREETCILEYSAKLAGIIHISFDQVAEAKIRRQEKKDAAWADVAIQGAENPILSRLVENHTIIPY